jgi:hypothetical protein
LKIENRQETALLYIVGNGRASDVQEGVGVIDVLDYGHVLRSRLDDPGPVNNEGHA